MAGSTTGTLFKITTWGESHGPALGVVIDGCPAGLTLCEADIQSYLNRRRPGMTRIATPRKEADTADILSGIFDGQTTGAPISIMVRNTSERPSDYRDIASCYRPGHADYTFDAKYGIRDYRGGGRSSGRETIGRVAAGAVAAKILRELGVKVTAYTQSIGPVTINPDLFREEHILTTATAMPDTDADARALAFLDECLHNSDSAGGIIACRITGVPAGIGEPVFHKLDAALAHAIMSVGAVKAVEIGDGISAAAALGSQNNDSFYCHDGSVRKRTNHAGGILGGISDGADILLRAHIKPTPSISAAQKTINKNGEEISIRIQGRHDPVIVPRAVVVIEAMTAITIVDAMMVNMASKMSVLKSVYGK